MQDQLSEQLVPDIIRSEKQGYDVNLLGYGQTGSGKTHCISDVADKLAVALFATPDKESEDDDDPTSESLVCESVKVTAFQIYGEEVMDLLQPEPTLVHAAKTKSVDAILSSLQIHTATSALALLALFESASSLRKSRSTPNSPYSSRSHLFFRIKTRRALITLVDLAGSEDPTASGAFKEGTEINRSLLVLGRCIEALRSGSSYVPWRDHLLTRMLESGLGGSGHGKLRLVACTSPFLRDIQDTHSTIRFASKARGLVLDAEVNIVERGEESLVELLKKENERLKRGFEALQERLKELEAGSIGGREVAGVELKGSLDSPAAEGDGPATPFPFELQDESMPCTPEVSQDVEESGVTEASTVEGDQVESFEEPGGPAPPTMEGTTVLPPETAKEEQQEPIEIVEEPLGSTQDSDWVPADDPLPESPNASQTSQEASQPPPDLDSQIALLVNTSDAPGLISLFRSMPSAYHEHFVSILATRAADLRTRNLQLRTVDRIRIAGNVLGIAEDVREQRRKEQVSGKEGSRVEKEGEKEGKTEDKRPRRSTRAKRGKENAVPSKEGLDFLQIVAANFGRKA